MISQVVSLHTFVAQPFVQVYSSFHVSMVLKGPFDPKFGTRQAEKWGTEVVNSAHQCSCTTQLLCTEDGSGSFSQKSVGIFILCQAVVLT